MSTVLQATPHSLPPTPRRRPTRWVRLLLVLSIGAIALLGAALWGVWELQQLPINVHFGDGFGDWEGVQHIDLAALSAGHKLALVLGIAIALLAVLVLVPLVLLLVLGGVLLGLVFGVGLPVLLVAALAALLCSPLLLMVWLLWLLLRDKPRRAAA